MNKSRRLNYVDSVAQLLSRSQEPLTIDALLSRVNGQRPVSESSRKAVVHALEQLYQAVPIAPSAYGWLSHLLTGSVFRHPLTKDEVRRGHLLLDELEHAVFFPEFFQSHTSDDRTLIIELYGHITIQAWTEVEHKIWSLRLGREFIDWVENQGGMGKDDLLITVIDAVAGRYGLRLQPREARDEEVVQTRDLQLAETAMDLLSDSKEAREGIPIWALAARLIGKGVYQHTTPPDELRFVLQKYSTLREDERGYFTVDIGSPFAEDDILSWEASGGRSKSNAGRKRTLFDRRDDFWEAEDPFVDPFMDPVKDPFMDPFMDVEDDLLFDQMKGEMDWLAEDEEDGICDAYAAYLDSFQRTKRKEIPLAHDDFHLLEAELETLVSLEQEFGYLLPEQLTRKNELADRLFIDPETLLDSDWDDPDFSEYDGPPFWQN